MQVKLSQHKSLRGTIMQVINVLSDGTIVEDMSTITVPVDNLIYEVCKRIGERHDRSSPRCETV